MPYLPCTHLQEGARADAPFFIHKDIARASHMDREIVERAARIAHLDLTEEELEKYEKDLTEILDYFQMLDEIPGEDTLGFNPILVEDAFREDEPRTEIDPDELLKGMKTYDDYIRGPRLS